MSDDEIDRRRWRFEKTIGISHILTTVIIAASAFVWAMKTETRIAVLENEQLRAHEVDLRTDNNLKDGMNELKSYLIRIETKLDKKVDKK